MKAKHFISALALCCGLAAGCGSDESESAAAATGGVPMPETTEESAQVIQRQFVEAPPAIQEKAKMAEQALQQRNYQDAVVALSVLQQSARTKEQKWAVYNSQIQIQKQIAQAVASGDENAKAAAEFLRRRSSGGR